MRTAYKILFRKPQGKTSFQRRGHKWEDGVKTSLREIECEGMV